jgi:uncharacterized membrane protein
LRPFLVCFAKRHVTSATSADHEAFIEENTLEVVELRAFRPHFGHRASAPGFRLSGTRPDWSIAAEASGEQSSEWIPHAPKPNSHDRDRRWQAIRAPFARVGEGAIMLTYVNGYTSTIWAMAEWYHPGCENGNWEKKGWWRIEPGRSAVVFGDDVEDVNRFWYFFAHAADGAFWAGPFEETVPINAFDWCENTGSSTSRTIGMRELDVGDNDDFTLTFVA